jgi:ribosomal protein L37AE/L43A
MMAAKPPLPDVERCPDCGCAHAQWDILNGAWKCFACGRVFWPPRLPRVDEHSLMKYAGGKYR